MYVGETGRSLRSRINGHRAGIIKDGQSLLYKHFRLAGHSVADMKVQILEKIYHSSENPVNIRLHRRLQELHWIKELGTAAPYGCNDQIKGVGTLSVHANILMSWAFLQTTMTKEKPWTLALQQKSSSARFKHRYYGQSH